MMQKHPFVLVTLRKLWMLLIVCSPVLEDLELWGSSIAATEYQSQSSFVEALYAIPYTVIRKDFNINSTASLNAGCVLPKGVSRIKYMLCSRVNLLVEDLPLQQTETQ